MARVRACAVSDEGLVFDARVGNVDGASWCAAQELVGGGEMLAVLLDRAAHDAQTARLDIAGSWFAEAYAWTLAGRAVAALLTDRRLPRLDVANVRMRFDDEQFWAAEVAFVRPDVLGLADDPAAASEDLQIVADADGLLRRLHEDLRDHLAGLFEVINARTRRPRRALWRGAADQLAGAFLWGGEALGRRDEAWALGERCMALHGELAVPPGYRVIHHAGLAEATRTRHSCCIAWRGGDKTTCFTCPLTTDADRRQRMQTWPGARHADSPPAAA